MLPCCLENLFSRMVLLRKVTERQDDGGSRNVLCDKIDFRKTADAGTINQVVLHGFIAEGIPLPDQLNP